MRNFRYFSWVGSISFLRYVCKFLHEIPWLLHHQNAARKNESVGLNFSYQTICFRIWGEHSTSLLPHFFWFHWCATLDIFHGQAAYHYWDMYVIFCIKFHGFCTIKMVPAKMNLWVSTFDIRLYAFRFGGEHSTSKLLHFFWLHWCITLDIFHGWAAYHYWDMYVNFASNSMIFAPSKYCLQK